MAGSVAVAVSALVLIGLAYGGVSAAWANFGTYSLGEESLGTVYAIPYCAFNVGSFFFRYLRP